MQERTDDLLEMVLGERQARRASHRRGRWLLAPRPGSGTPAGRLGRLAAARVRVALLAAFQPRRGQEPS